MASRFRNLQFMAFADNYEDGLNLILEYNPKIVFLEIDPENAESNLSLRLITELYRYLKILPKFIITTKGKELAFEAIKYEVFDYLTKPLELSEFRKSVLKFERTASDLPQSFTNVSESHMQPVPAMTITAKHESDNPSLAAQEIVMPFMEAAAEVETEMPEEPQIINPVGKDKPLIICVKSYGDYRFINADDICYLQADNNSTDIHLNNGEMITAFKTLKHFETVLNSPFVRIHNSYIVNIDYVSRIHTGNAVCYIKNTTTKLPFSKSYKENIDSILNSITKGNYLEI